MDDTDDDRPGLARVDFSEDEERSLGRLASALGLVGMLQILLSGIGVVLLVIGLLMKLQHMSLLLLLVGAIALLNTGLPVWQGVMLREAGESIGRVAGADDDDQEYLASAFRRLRTVFVIELVLALYALYQAMD
jgi:hypothetical protein